MFFEHFFDIVKLQKIYIIYHDISKKLNLNNKRPIYKCHLRMHCGEFNLVVWPTNFSLSKMHDNE